MLLLHNYIYLFVFTDTFVTKADPELKYILKDAAIGSGYEICL